MIVSFCFFHMTAGNAFLDSLTLYEGRNSYQLITKGFVYFSYLSSSSGCFSVGFRGNLELSLTVSKVTTHSMPIMPRTLSAIAATLESDSTPVVSESDKLPEGLMLRASIFTVRLTLIYIMVDIHRRQ